MDHNTAQKDDYRIIFDEDYKSRKSKAQSISIIKEQVAKIIEEDPFLRAKRTRYAERIYPVDHK